MPKTSQTFLMRDVIKLGKTIRFLREQYGKSQIEAAKLLGISNVHLSNLENNKAYPSPDVAAKITSIWGVDLYVLAWCLHGDVRSLPTGVQKAAIELTRALKRQLTAQGISVDGGSNDRHQEQQESGNVAGTSGR
jgi:transcriptional regulator with XRE-family HTH domain